MNSRSAIFLDRDGTIIEDQHYPKDPSRVIFCPNASQGLRLMLDKGYLLFVVSNQSGVGRGLIRDDEFRAVHHRCAEILKNAHIEIAEFIYCLHRPEDDCQCRKPKIGQIPKTFKGQALDWKTSFTIGDRLSDLELADALGATGFLVLTGKGQETLKSLGRAGSSALGDTPRYGSCEDLLDFAEQIPLVG